MNESAAARASLVAAVLVVGLASPFGRSGGEPTVTPLAVKVPVRLAPLEGHGQSEAHAINADGRIAGISFDPGPPVAVVWDGERPPTRLPSSPGDVASTALGVNDAGDVVGWSRGADGTQRAAVWDRDGGVTALRPLPGQGDCVAYAINDDRVAVGVCTVDDAERAVVWKDRGSDPVELPRLPGDPQSDARGINAEGIVVGWSKGPSSESADRDEIRTAMLWGPAGVGTVLAPLPGRIASLALAINDRGLVAGESYTLEGVFTAVLWGHDGTPLPRLPLPGGEHSGGTGLSDSGVVVGQSFPATGALWDVAGAAVALPPLSEHARSWATGVNQGGVAVGVSRSDAGNTAVVWR